jgi:hypothetical protein
MTLNHMTEPGSSNPIYPFILPPKYQILVCQTCQYAYLASETATHLAKKYAGIDPGTRRRLVEEIKVIPGVLRSRIELSQLQYPPPTTEPIPCLAPPKLDALKCRLCNFNVRQVQAMQEHCTRPYHWVNPRGKGRPPIGHPSADPVPWIEGVACQRFFPSREGSKWFQVSLKAERQNVGKSKAKPTPKKPQAALQNLTSEASTHLQQVMEWEAGYQDTLNQPRMTSKDTTLRHSLLRVYGWIELNGLLSIGVPDEIYYGR